MSFVSPNIFDFVARKNDERSVHEKILVQVLTDKRYSDSIWKNLRPSDDYELIRVIEQYKVEGNSKREQRYIDILLLAENNNSKDILPIVCELKTNTKASAMQLSDYYCAIKGNKEICTPGNNPICFYITPNGRKPEEKSLKFRNSSDILEIDKEVKLISYKELMSGIEECQTSRKGDFDFVLSQYINLVNESEFCGVTSVENTKTNFNQLKKLCNSVYENIKKKRRSIFDIDQNIDKDEEPYYYVDVYNDTFCLCFEVGYSSISGKEDKNHLRILYGAKKKGPNYSWNTANYAQYLKNLDENGKTIYCNGNKKDASFCSKFLTQGSGENHLNSSTWLFAQNLSWLATDIVNNKKQLENVSVKIADFILDDLSMIH